MTNVEPESKRSSKSSSAMADDEKDDNYSNNVSGKAADDDRKSRDAKPARVSDRADHSKPRRSRSGSNGRKRDSVNGRRKPNRRSASRSRGRRSPCRDGSSEFVADGERRRVSPRGGKRSISPKSFGSDEDRKPRVKASQDSPTRSKGSSVTSRHKNGKDSSVSEESPISSKRYSNPTISTELGSSSWHSKTPSATSSTSIGADDGEDLQFVTPTPVGSKPKVKSSRRSKSSRSSSKQKNNGTTDLVSPLSGPSLDDKTRAKTSRKQKRSSKASSSSRDDLLSPSGQSKSSSVTTSRSSIEILYGDDSNNNAKAKARFSPHRMNNKRSSKQPGFELVVSPSGQSVFTSNSTELLYGHDSSKKVRAKALRGSFELVSPSSISTSYSNSTDPKAKGLTRGTSMNSKRSYGSKSTVTEILYGDDDDAKKKARSKRSSRSNNNKDHHQHPGIERVEESEHNVQEDETELSFDEMSHHQSSSNRRVSPPSPMEGSVVTGIMIEGSSISLQPSTVGTAVENNTTPEQATTPKKKKKKRNSKKKKQKAATCSYAKYIILAIVILLIGGGATAFIALSRYVGDDNDEMQDPATSSSPNTNEVTKPPSSSGSSNDGIPTEPPTTSKNNKVLDPPSPEDCAAIRNNQTVPGQEDSSTPPHNFNVNVEISVKGETEMTDEMVQELLDNIQELLLPSMVGCNNNSSSNNADQQQRRFVKETPSVIRGAIRKLNDNVVLDESRFAILFAYVKGQVQEDAVCVGTYSSPAGSCYVVLVEFSLYLDGDITSSELESILYEELESGNDIVSKLNLGDSFLSANATKIMDGTPPSSSKVPSWSPMDDIVSESPSSSPTKNTLPSPMPTDVPSTSPSTLPSITPSSPPPPPSSSPTIMPVVGPSPPPTVAPSTSMPSSSPSNKPSTAPSSSPTVHVSGYPSATPSSMESYSPTKSPIPSSAPSPVPSKTTAPSSSPSLVPSFTPSTVPTLFPTLSPTSTPTTTSTAVEFPAPTTDITNQCYCRSADACDESVLFFSMGCGACDSLGACTMLGSSSNTIPSIGDNSCTSQYACQHAVIMSFIGGTSCRGDYSCQNRILLEVQSGSCHGLHACAANPANYNGGLTVGSNSCIGQYACYSHELSAPDSSASCTSSWACAGRTKLFVANGACKAPNACSGAVFSNGSIYQAQTQTSYFGANSCTCEECCVCMIRVVSGRCQTRGECCDIHNATLKVEGVQDNTEEEMKTDLGVNDLSILFGAH